MEVSISKEQERAAEFFVLLLGGVIVPLLAPQEERGDLLRLLCSLEQEFAGSGKLRPAEPAAAHAAALSSTEGTVMAAPVVAQGVGWQSEDISQSPCPPNSTPGSWDQSQ